MPNPHLPKSRSIGLGAGAIWLIAVGGGFTAWSIFAIIGDWSELAVGWLLCIAALLAIGVIVVRDATDLPPDDPALAIDRRKITRRFLQVFGAEFLACAIVNAIAAAYRRFELMPSLTLVIVGLHFLPLASLFRVPRYYAIGFFFCVIPITTIIAVSKDAFLGRALAWYVVPGLGCGLIATLFGAAGLFESRQILAQSRRHSV